jgi:hypothetical protein
MAPHETIDYECPECHQLKVTKLDNMIRCSCGWWRMATDKDFITRDKVDYSLAKTSSRHLIKESV